ncbi:MAG: hypothetical protein ACJ8EU_17160, partial [Xanthobacteraceae bacterium]
IEFELGQRLAGNREEFGPALVFLFLAKDRNQISNTWRTVEQFFVRCGFVLLDPNRKGEYRSDDNAIRIHIIVGMGRHSH